MKITECWCVKLSVFQRVKIKKKKKSFTPIIKDARGSRTK